MGFRGSDGSNRCRGARGFEMSDVGKTHRLWMIVDRDVLIISTSNAAMKLLDRKTKRFRELGSEVTGHVASP